MKLLPSLAIGLGLVGAGLTAPVPTPHLVPSDDGLLVAVDAVLEPSWPDSYAERLSRYASAAVQRLRVFQVTPVFAVDPDDAPVITEDDGEVVLVGDNQWLGAVVWDPSTRILSLDPMSCLVCGCYSPVCTCSSPTETAKSTSRSNIVFSMPEPWPRSHRCIPRTVRPVAYERLLSLALCLS